MKDPVPLPLLLSIPAVLAGFSFAYIERNNHEGIGVYGVVVGLAGLLAYLNELRKWTVRPCGSGRPDRDADESDS